MNRRRLIPALTAVTVLVLIVWAYWPAPVAISASAVTRGPVQVVVQEDGVTRIRDRYTVMSPVTGYVGRLQLRVGDRVEAGQTLFTLEPLPAAALDVRAKAEAEAQVARARAAERAAETAARAAEASAELARRELARLEPLLKTGAVSRNQYEQAAAEAERSAANLASARSAIEVARYEREAAQTTLRYAGGARVDTAAIEVRAPIDGAVLILHREDEGAVQGGTPMLMLGDPHSLEIVVDVLSADAVRIRAGMPVQLEDWGGGVPLAARVRHVEPVGFTKISALGVEEQRVRVICDLAEPAERWRELGDGYRVDARFILHDAADALRVPHSSLFRVDDRWSVFVVLDGRARLREVRLGARGLLHSEIRDGLKEGEVVVTYPDDRIVDGTRVRVAETETF
ncbi:MAG: efflux RND transporter periplasmic adaptor subunit [Gammaproteobacteria bacterium]